MSDISDLEIRMFFAAVVGAVRAPFGQRRTALLSTGQSKVIANNGTKASVLSIVVSRADLQESAADVIFSQTDNGNASANDYSVTFNPTDTQRFTLKPGDVLTLQVTLGVGVFVIGQETY